MSYEGWSPSLYEPTATKLTATNVVANTAFLEQIQQKPGSLLTEITVGTDLLFSSSLSEINGLNQLGFDGAGTNRRIDGCAYLANLNSNALNILIGGGSTEVLNFMTNGDQVRATMNAGGLFDFTLCPTTSVGATTSNELVNLTTLQNAGKPTREFYVSKQGADTNPGSITAPFLTVQAAINAAEAITPSSSAMVIIHVAAGRYAESLTHTLGYVSIVGDLANTKPTGTTMIDGNVSITIGGADDLFGKQINYSGLQINGAITDTSTAQHSISFTNCYLYSTTRNVNQNSSADCRTYITNCDIQQSSGTGPQIETQNGLLYVERCNISTDANFNSISIAGASTGTRIAFNIIENSNADNALEATIAIFSSTIASHNIGGNSIVWTTLGSAPFRTTTPNASGVLFSTGAVNPNAIITQNVFALLGSTDSGNANHAIMKDAAMTGNVSIVNAGNYAFAGATKVLNTITQIASSLVS
jgi:hypothetical protein